MSETITPELRAALARLCDDHRRFRHVPGYNDGPMELGDWTLIHRAIDPDMQPTREGIPDPPGTIPAAAVPSPKVIRAMGYITDWMEGCLRDGKLGGTLTASTEAMREYLNGLEDTK